MREMSKVRQRAGLQCVVSSCFFQIDAYPALNSATTGINNYSENRAMPGMTAPDSNHRIVRGQCKTIVCKKIANDLSLGPMHPLAIEGAQFLGRIL
jgi:hypothetical protein